MKKFISFVMTGAMVASLVPATAFAKGEPKATAKVVDALNITKDQAVGQPTISEGADWVQQVPELQLKITDTYYRGTDPSTEKVDVTVSLDGAKFDVDKDGADLPGNAAGDKAALHDLVEILYTKDRGESYENRFVANNTNGTILYNATDKKQVAIPTAPTAAGKATIDFLMNVTGETPSLTKVTQTEVYANGVKVIAGTGAGTAAFVDADTFGMDELIAAILAGDTFTSDAAGSTDITDAFTALVEIDDSDAGGGGLAGDDWATATITATNQIAAYKANGYAQGDFSDEPVDGTGASAIGTITWEVKDYSDDEITFTFTGRFAVDDIIVIDLCSTLNKTNVGKNAVVSVSSPMVDANDMVYVSVEGRGITATTKKVGSIAEEEFINLESDLKISSTVGNFADGQWFELKLSKGFEFGDVDFDNNAAITRNYVNGNTLYIEFAQGKPDDDAFTIGSDEIEIESTSAKSGATCTLTVKALDKAVQNKDGDLGSVIVGTGTSDVAFKATTTVEILKVVDYKVILSVDEDEDVPVIYSGVDVDNYGITDDSDHWSLEVTAKESFPGAWSMRKGFNFELPEHVYVADIDGVDVTSTDNFYWNGKEDQHDVTENDVEAAFWNAYRNGSHANFEFAKRVFDDVDSDLRDRECAEMVFKLRLVADPGFEGDVVLKLTGELVDEQEVTIAKFVKPYEVKAEQNDMIIDYRYTEIPTAITLTEAEKGLWAKDDATFYFNIEDNKIAFDDDPTFEIDSKSDLEIKNDKVSGGTMEFTVKAESDEPATVTIKNLNMYMQRNIPAGPYDLEIDSSLAKAYEAQILFAPDSMEDAKVGDDSGIDAIGGTKPTPLPNKNHDDDCDTEHRTIAEDSYVGCVADYNKVVKEAFINVVTAGRDQDDASFTTKVVVPVGENYIVAGEKQVELDTPAYINAAGYTMLPIRAVAVALGINSNNVLWDQPTKTVTILYGQRIITMTQGQKVVYVNGSAIPASAAVENTNSRTFLPMRDLATALGVTDITWDQATRTATLNGNQK